MDEGSHALIFNVQGRITKNVPMTSSVCRSTCFVHTNFIKENYSLSGSFAQTLARLSLKQEGSHPFFKDKKIKIKIVHPLIV